jgi:hypothetical protein
MKRIFLIVSFIAGIYWLSSAQGEFDALKYSQTSIVGSARYMSMSGAFGALGGDISSLRNNPAGIGVYRSSDFSITLGGIVTNVAGKWENKWGYQNQYNSTLNSVGYVMNIKPDDKYGSGILNSNFAISYNKLNNFNRAIYLKSGNAQNTSITQYFGEFTTGLTETNLKKTDTYEPYNNVNVPWLSVLAYDAYMINPDESEPTVWHSLLAEGQTVTPTYEANERGNIDEWAFSYGANFNDNFYLGVALGIQSVDYTLTSKYAESFTGGGNMQLVNNFNTSGSGINLKLGAIFRPVSFLRFGLAFHTPTIYNLTDTYKSTLYYPALAINNNVSGYANTPTATNTYTLLTPLKANISGAVVFSKLGLISLEYELTNYTGMALSDNNGVGFIDENQGIITYLKDSHTIKLGGELKIIPNFALRGGWAYTSPATSSDARKLLPLNTTRTDTEYFLDKGTSYYSGGIGYREGNWYFDVAYLLKNTNQDFYAYNFAGASVANISTKSNNIVCTFGFKF